MQAEITTGEETGSEQTELQPKNKNNKLLDGSTKEDIEFKIGSNHTAPTERAYNIPPRCQHLRHKQSG